MKKRSIARRLSLLVISIFAILFVLYAVVTNWISYGKNIANGEASTNEHTRLLAANMESRLGDIKKTLDISKQNLEAVNHDGKMDTNEILLMMKKNLEGNSDIFATAVVLDKGSVRTNARKDATLLDRDGRYIPYVHKGSTTLTTEKVNGYSGTSPEDWYRIPKTENRSTLTEPYTYEVDGKNVLMSTFSIPLNDANGKFIGVMTADFPLDFAASLVKDIKKEDGYAALISDAGTILAHSSNEKMIGTNMAEAIEWDKQKQLIDTGRTADFYVDSKTFGEQAFNSIAPINIGGLEEKWSFQSVTPKSSILDTYNQLLKITIIAGITIILLMAAAALLFIYRQLKPLQDVKGAMEKAAAGDLTVRIPQDRFKPDEIGAVSTAFNEMVEKQNSVIQTIKQSTEEMNSSADAMQHTFDEVAAASNEVATAVDEIAQGASRQSEDTESTSGQMTNLAAQIDKLSALSEKMSALSDTANDSTASGMKQVHLLKEQTEAANVVNDTVQEQIKSLSSKIGEINVITASIQAITEQTNLLALNASIEAARAGEQGKGFAVVAEEVRKLAEQSKQQTEVIQTTVLDILHTSEETVESISKNTAMREASDKSVSETENAFTANANVLNELILAIQSTADSLSGMLVAKDDAVLSLQNVTAISEETAASAEQVSASATEQQREMANVAASIDKMNTIAEELENMMSQFKVD